MLQILRATICEQIAAECAAHYGRQLRAVVLTGSLARDEATFVKEWEASRLLGDAEFLMIFHERSALPADPDLDLLRQRIEEGLLRDGMRCHLTLSAVHPMYLRKLRPHIFAYELRACGQVIWGEPQILSLIPAFSPSDIPLEDAWRLLCNRMIEHLEVAHELADGHETLSPSVHYRTVKLYLDMATSFLVFADGYAPTYARRAENLQILAAGSTTNADWPFPLKSFAAEVAACTAWKLSSEGRQISWGLEFLRRAVEYAQQLWRWELFRLTGASRRLHDRELVRLWMQQQRLRRRLRGWLYVSRRQGWLRSCRQWPRWARLAWRASPRHWIYAAGSELFFKAPSPLAPNGRSGDSGDWDRLRNFLPVLAAPSSRQWQPGWRQLAADIVWNYHEFLVETRA